MIAKATAKKWVEKNKINKKMDKTAEDYVQRVLVLISSGSSDRAELRTRKARAEAQACHGMGRRYGANSQRWPNRPDRAEKAARKRRQNPADGGGSGSRVRQTEAT